MKSKGDDLCYDTILPYLSQIKEKSARYAAGNESGDYSVTINLKHYKNDDGSPIEIDFVCSPHLSSTPFSQGAQVIMAPYENNPFVEVLCFYEILSNQLNPSSELYHHLFRELFIEEFHFHINDFIDFFDIETLNKNFKEQLSQMRIGFEGDIQSINDVFDRIAEIKELTGLNEDYHSRLDKLNSKYKTFALAGQKLICYVFTHRASLKSDIKKRRYAKVALVFPQLYQHSFFFRNLYSVLNLDSCNLYDATIELISYNTTMAPRFTFQPVRLGISQVHTHTSTGAQTHSFKLVDKDSSVPVKEINTDQNDQSAIDQNDQSAIDQNSVWTPGEEMKFSDNVDETQNVQSAIDQNSVGTLRGEESNTNRGWFPSFFRKRKKSNDSTSTNQQNKKSWYDFLRRKGGKSLKKNKNKKFTRLIKKKINKKRTRKHNKNKKYTRKENPQII